jgi:hypothetical protein
MGQRIDPTCDVCGTEKQYRHGIGSYCPNVNCGGTETPETIKSDTPPPDGHFVKLGAPSVQMVLEENIRAKTSLTKAEAVDLFAVLTDGTERRIVAVKLQVKPSIPDRRPGLTVTTSPSARFPKGFPLTLASRDGVSL